MRGFGWAAALVVLGSWGCARNHAPPQTVALHYEGPIRSRDVVEGGRIYITLCTACHRGRVNPRGYTWGPGQMRHQIREGNRLMPPLGDELLSDAQVEAVLAYLSVMGALEGELPPVRQSDDGLDLDDEVAEAGAEAEAEELAVAEALAAAEAEALAEAAQRATEAAEAYAEAEAEAEAEAAPLEPADPWGETGDSLAPPGGSDVRPAPSARPLPEPIVDGTTVGDTVLKAEAMSFVFSNFGDGSATRLHIRVQPGQPVALTFQGLRVDGGRVVARQWRIGEGPWTEGDQPLQIDSATTLEIQLEHPVRGTGGSLEARLTVGGRRVTLPVPTHTSHETVEPI